MSTRRARIKAVTALPPRRKNTDADAKTKQNAPKEGFEKCPKSPRTPKSYAAKSDEKSPAKTLPVRTPPALLPITSTTTASPVPALSPKIQTPKDSTLKDSTQNEKNTTPLSEKVSVITSASSLKGVFASPPPRNAPERRATPSPNVLSSPKPLFTETTKSGVESTETMKLGIEATGITKSDVESTETTNLGAETGLKNTNGQSREISDTAHMDKDTNEHVNDIVQYQNKDFSPSTDRNKKNDIPDDYTNLPSVPESITDDTVMDGIVPLQPTKNVPKPIDLLKNELISENAEVLFDPIVPLPSPSKVRPKLRPVPRLGPHRRNSVQGSASESEDESRRALMTGAPAPAPQRQRNDSHTSHSTLLSIPNRELNRVRNDSISSCVSQMTAHPPPATSPVKEKHFTKTRRPEDRSKRVWRRHHDTVKRDALTMYDLIFYNPTTNPLVPDQDEIKAKEANAKETEKCSKTQESEEDPDDPPANEAPVPQIKLGPNGEIILDEKSLIIKQSDANRKVKSVVREGSWAGSGGGKYTRAARTAEWTDGETVRFYRALAAIGTDFTLMAPLFPDRTRRELKIKFKKEEKINGTQVDKALMSATSWDAMRLQEEFKSERKEEAEKAEEAKQRVVEKKRAEKERMKLTRELRLRSSKAAKAVETTRDFAPPLNREMTADDFLRRALEQGRESKRARKTKIKLNTPEINENSPKINTPPANFATLSLINDKMPVPPTTQPSNHADMATITRLNTMNATVPLPPSSPRVSEISEVPSNIETGSLVVLRVSDPKSPSKTMLQTYIAHGAGKLTPVSLPPTFLNSVVGYMKKGTPKSTISASSSPLLASSPNSIASQDSRSCTPGVIQYPGPTKRQRNSSYTITSL